MPEIKLKYVCDYCAILFEVREKKDPRATQQDSYKHDSEMYLIKHGFTPLDWTEGRMIDD